MERLIQDLRVGVRSMRRTPGFALTAVVTLALGIGFATAVFTVAEALLLRRLPVPDQERVVALWGEKRDGSFGNYPVSLDDARAFAQRTRTLDRVGFYAYEGAWPAPIREGDGLSRMRRAFVMGDFFDAVGARPLLGRALQPDDDRMGAAPVVVLSHGAWRRHFGGDPAVIGRQIVLHESGVAHTVVGVMPQGLDFPRGTEMWAAVLAATPESNLQYLALNVVGHLAPGATAAAAAAELTTFFEGKESSVWQRGLRGVAQPLPRLILGETRTAVQVFAGAAALLLLITCINIANLLLVRGLGRTREVAVRSALGARRGRVVSQLLAEHTLLAAAGGAAGLLVALAALRAFVAFAPPGLPRLDEIALDATVLAGAIGITSVATLLFALAPALVASRVEVVEVLRSGTRLSASRRSRLVREGLVAGQVALAVVVLSAAGLIVRSLLKLERADLAFDASHLLVADLALTKDGYGTAPQQHAMLARLLPAVQEIAGVRAVTPVVAVPFSGAGGWDGRPASESQTPAEAASNPMLNMEVAAPSYFATFGMPVLRGRGFTDQDRQGSQRVVVLSESAARFYWPDGDPIGRRLRMGGGLEEAFTVVGIVADTRYRDLRVARPSIYFPIAQSFFPFAPTKLAIRTTGAPELVVPALRRVIGEVAPGVALASAAPFEELLAVPLAQPRLNAFLLAVFAGAALTLAGVGLFGVLATMVRQRTQEMGVRVALGASPGDIARLVVARGMLLALAGTSVGLLAALTANRLLSALLFDISPSDAPTLAAVVLLLLGVSALASLIPARAGMRVEPMTALRAE